MKRVPAFVFLVLLLPQFFSFNTFAACSSPAANVGSLDFQSGAFKYCDGTNWQNLSGTPSFPLLGPNGGVGAPTYSFSAGTNTGIYSLGPGTLAFTTAGTLAGVINNLGYHGIGTATPQVPLEVMTNSNGFGVRVNRSGGATIDLQGGSTAGWVGTPSNHPVYFFTNNSSQQMTLATSGNLGIGTTSPLSKLQVGTQLAAGTDSLFMGSGAGPGIIMNGTGANYSNIYPGNDRINFGFSASVGAVPASPVMTIQSSGKVGIGTASPNRLLHVAGDARFTSNVAMGNQADVNTSGIFYPTDSIYATFLNENRVTTGTATYVQGVTSYLEYDPSIAAGTINTYAADFEIQSRATNAQPIGAINGMYLFSEHKGTGTLQNLMGEIVGTSLSGAASVSENTGVAVHMLKTAGSINNRYGVAINTPTGAATNHYGLWLGDQSSGGSTAYNIYSDGASSKNYFGGSVGIGTTSINNKVEIYSTPTTTYSSTAIPTNMGLTVSNVNASTFNQAMTNIRMTASSGSNPAEGSINLIQNGNSNPGSIMTFQLKRSLAGAIGEAMRIDYTTGAPLVGIGTVTPGYNLHVVGNAGLSSGTAWTNASDIRLKTIDGDYDYGLDEILKLHTVRFHYKKDNALGLPSSQPMTGFIAQEVQKVIPDAVSIGTKGYLQLNVDPIHWATVNAVQELHGMCKSTDDRVLVLEQKNAKLENRVKDLESRLERLERLVQPAIDRAPAGAN